MLVCLNLYIRPQLYIVDGIMAMEGNGPHNGDLDKLNVLLFSTDPIALDATMCRIIDLNPEFVLTLKSGQEWGLGTCLSEEGVCVKMCPVTPKAVDWHDGDKSRPPTHKYERCIRCFCCQELCPERAIRAQTPLLGRLLYW